MFTFKWDYRTSRYVALSMLWASLSANKARQTHESNSVSGVCVCVYLITVGRGSWNMHLLQWKTGLAAFWEGVSKQLANRHFLNTWSGAQRLMGWQHQPQRKTRLAQASRSQQSHYSKIPSANKHRTPNTRDHAGKLQNCLTGNIWDHKHVFFHVDLKSISFYIAQ